MIVRRLEPLKLVNRDLHSRPRSQCPTLIAACYLPSIAPETCYRRRIGVRHVPYRAISFGLALNPPVRRNYDRIPRHAKPQIHSFPGRGRPRVRSFFCGF